MDDAFSPGVYLEILQFPADLVLHPNSSFQIICSVTGISDPYMYWHRWTATNGLKQMFGSVGSKFVDPSSVDGYYAVRPNGSHMIVESAGVTSAAPAVWYCSWSPR